MAGAREKIRPSRVLEMSLHMELPDIARAMRISVEEVVDLIDRARGPKSPVTLICHKSGRWWHVNSWRGAYFKVCILGLTEWSWHAGHWVKEGADDAISA